jgi:hypothetical protein
MSDTIYTLAFIALFYLFAKYWESLTNTEKNSSSNQEKSKYNSGDSPQYKPQPEQDYDQLSGKTTNDRKDTFQIRYQELWTKYDPNWSTKIISNSVDKKNQPKRSV